MSLRWSPACGIACMGLVAAVAGCGGDGSHSSSSSSSSSSGSPTSFEATVKANPLSVCAVYVTFTLEGATSAHVTATGGTDDLTTPDSMVDGNGQVSISVLGLAASTKYDFVVEAQVDDKTVKSSPVSFTTSALPTQLANVVMKVTPNKGKPAKTGYYLVEGTGPFAFAVDGAGTVRWYHEFGNFSAETKMQEDGTFTTFVGNTMGYEPDFGEYVRYTPDGQPVSLHKAVSPDASEAGKPTVYLDNHDLLITKDASGTQHAHMIAYELRPFSSTDTTLAAWHVIQRQTMDGAIEMEWKTWSRFTSADAVDPLPIVNDKDMDHMNALSLDPSDDNYIVSMRDLDAVIKVDQASGKVLWQIGGTQSTMKVEKDPLTTFYGQHGAHLLKNGHLLMLDNGVLHSPPESRAAEYAIDTKAGTATLVWEYRHDPALYVPIEGSVTRLANGNTFVAFAFAGTVDEVDPSGAVVWEGQLMTGTTTFGGYRVLPLPSLYQYEVP